MHKLQMYESLRDMLEREVKDIEKKGDLTEQSLDHLYKLMTALKVADRCIDREKGEENGMVSNNSYGSYGYRRNSYNSYDGMSNGYSGIMPYSRDNSMGNMPNGMSNGMSNDMSNEGMSNARRGRDGDNDGRYNESRDNFRNSQDRGNSYENSYGYSRDTTKKKMIQKLETLMDDTMSEHERQAIMDCINKIK